MASVSTDRLQGVNVGAAVKVPCRLATTANITLSGLQTIDGVVTVQDDRVLVKNQTTSSQNGIYLADSGAWERDKDWDGSFDVKKGTVVHVTEGSTYTRTWWEVTTSDPITPGTTNVTIIQGIADAVNVTFLPSGIGTLTPQARTLQAKGREVITTADFSGSPPAGLVGIGPGVLATITSGGQNVAIGDSALAANTSGVGNTAVGYQALKNNTIGGSAINGANTAIGITSMFHNISGDNNTAVGVDSLFTNTTGSNNVAIGSNAIGFGDGGGSNTAVGWRSLFNGGAGTANTAIGLTSLNTLTAGSYNTGLGTSALFTLASASNNTGVGSFALYSNSVGAGNVALGYFAGYYELGSNNFYVDNQDRGSTANDTAKALMHGTFNASPALQTLQVNAQFSAVHADAAVNQLFAGTTKAVRIGHTATESLIEGVDVTGVASYQPLFIGGSTITFQLSGATKAIIAAGLQMGAPTGGDKGVGTINAAGAYYANGTAGVATFGPAAVASITIKNGLVTAIS